MTDFGGYTLGERIASGGMAEVFLATRVGPEGFEKKVAIKRMLAALGEREGFRTMFLDEARLVAKLSHANIVQIFDMGEADGRLFLAMEYIDGQPLSDVLAKCRTRHLRLPHALAAHICAELCLGLDYAHNFTDEAGEPLHIIHRDISPQNVMLTRDGSLKIVDFGIAKAASNLYRTQQVSLKGKIHYMSPEQVEGKLALDRRTDVYSCGVVLYEMLCRDLPHQATSVSELMSKIVYEAAPDPRKSAPELPPELARVVRRALERDRDRRYPDCRSMRSELLDYLRRQQRAVDSYALKDFQDKLERTDPRAQRVIVPREPRADSAVDDEATAAGDATRVGIGTDGEESAAKWWLFLVVILLLGLSLSAFLLLSDDAPAPAPTVAQKMLPPPGAEPMPKLTEPTPPSPQTLPDPDTPDPDRMVIEAPAKYPSRRRRRKARQKKRHGKKRTQEKSKVSRLSLARLRKSKALIHDAKTAMDHKEYNKSVRLLEAALRMTPKNSEIYFLTGRAFEKMGSVAMALENYAKYVKRCPKCYNAEYALRYIKDHNAEVLLK